MASFSQQRSHSGIHKSFGNITNATKAKELVTRNVGPIIQSVRLADKSINDSNYLDNIPVHMNQVDRHFIAT